jgi:hypothetical protein
MAESPPNKSMEQTGASRSGEWQCVGQRWLAPAAHAGRSPMRAERAKPKSCKDDEIIAQGKRSAALGYRRKMIPWAIILLPLRGVGKAHQRAGGDGGMIALFRAARLWPTAHHHGR